MNTVSNPIAENLVILGTREEPNPVTGWVTGITTFALRAKDHAEGLKLRRKAWSAGLGHKDPADHPNLRRALDRLQGWQGQFTKGNGADADALLEGPAEFRFVLRDHTPH